MSIDINKQYWELLNKLDIVSIVAISARPGTDFMQSLFDSHPQILTFDGWIKFHSFYKKAISIYGTQNLISGDAGSITELKIENISPSDFFYEFAWKHLHKFNSRYDTLEKKDKLGKKNEYNKINIDDFVEKAVGLIGTNTLTSRNSFLAVYGAYSLARGEDLSIKKVLLHQAHLTPYIPSLINDFPNTKVIAMIRDPRHYATAINVYQNKIPISKINIGTANGLFRLMIDGVDPLLKVKNIKLKISVLEKLHNNPKKVINNICSWIGIDFMPVLLTSTWNGKEWFGDSLSKNINEIFDSNRYVITQKKWKKNLSLIDKIIVENLMKKEINRFNYVKRFNSKLWSIFVPFLIMLPTKYEKIFFKKIFKEKKYFLYIDLLKIIFSRYFFSYKKYFKNLFYKEDVVGIF